MCEYMEILNTGRPDLCKGQLLNNCIFAMTDRGLRETIGIWRVGAYVCMSVRARVSKGI